MLFNIHSNYWRVLLIHLDTYNAIHAGFQSLEGFIKNEITKRNLTRSANIWVLDC
jgi:hypothetical protein